MYKNYAPLPQKNPSGRTLNLNTFQALLKHYFVLTGKEINLSCKQTKLSRKIITDGEREKKGEKLTCHSSRFKTSSSQATHFSTYPNLSHCRYTGLNDQRASLARRPLKQETRKRMNENTNPPALLALPEGFPLL
ncbi:hypothetical protein TNCV_1113271 [Trichonephila clavipes]|nr:hypothetical protein TNCV_1113271 [Trichonephila clavipes]